MRWPFEEDFLLKFLVKLPRKIGEKLHNELINWFKIKWTKGLSYYAILLRVVEYVRGRLENIAKKKNIGIK